MVANAEEIAFWNDAAGARWSTFHERIDRAFAALGTAGLAAAGARPDDSVLDIGCGCGASSLSLGEAVGATGSVIGVDVSRPMLAIAKGRATALGLSNVRFSLADASTENFAAHRFALAFSRFGVMFFEDPVAAFVNVRRALAPRGKLVFVCWRELAANPWFSVPAEAVRPLLPVQPKPDPEAPGPLAFADPARVRGFLEQAGFDDVRFDSFDALLPLGTRACASELLSEIGPAARLLEGADERVRTAARLALDDALRAHEADGNVALRGGIWIVRARASG